MKNIWGCMFYNVFSTSCKPIIFLPYFNLSVGAVCRTIRATSVYFWCICIVSTDWLLWSVVICHMLLWKGTYQRGETSFIADKNCLLANKPNMTRLCGGASYGDRVTFTVTGAFSRNLPQNRGKCPCKWVRTKCVFYLSGPLCPSRVFPA